MKWRSILLPMMQRACLGLLVLSLAVLGFSSHFIEGNPKEEIPMSEVYGGDDVLLSCVNSSWKIFDLVIWMRHETNETIKIAEKEYGIGLDLINRGYRFVGPMDLFIPALTDNDTGLYSCQLLTASREILSTSFLTLKVTVLCRLTTLSPHLRSRDCNSLHAVLENGICSFKCEENYTLVGSHELVCLSSGHFSAPMPECHEVPVVKAYAGNDVSLPCNLRQKEHTDTLIWKRYDGDAHSTLLKKEEEITIYEQERTISLVNETSLFIANVRIDDRALYQCKLVNKSAVKFYSYNITLDVTERCFWPKRSPELQEFPNRCKGDFVTEGVSCSFKCKEGYVLSKNITVSCFANGSFSDALPSCQVVNCTIAKFGANLHSETEQCREGAVVPFGTTCYFSCSIEHQLVNGDSVRTCQANATLSGKSGKCEETITESPMFIPLMVICFVIVPAITVVALYLYQLNKKKTSETEPNSGHQRSLTDALISGTTASSDQ